MSAVQGFLHVRRRQWRTSAEGRVASPFQPLHLQGSVNLQPLDPFDPCVLVIVREGPEAPVTGVVTGRQMPLADVVDRVPGPSQQLGVADPIQKLPVEDSVEVAHVGQEAVIVGIQARQQRGARRGAQGSRREGRSKPHAVRRQAVHARCAHHRVAAAAQGVMAVLIGQQQQDIGAMFGHGYQPL